MFSRSWHIGDTIKAIQLRFQFIDPVEIIPCDKYGCDYYNSRHDVELRIPEGAILSSDGMIKIEFGVAMYGPFKFSDGIRRVSPIVWLCIQQDDFSRFQKDVEITIPHFLDFSTEDAYEYLRFLKADHQLEDGEIEYQLKPADGRALFDRATHGTLLTKHFCSVCIATSVRPNEQSTRYYLGGAIRLKEQDWQIIFYVCYFLPSCLRIVERQLNKNSKVIYPTDFMFADGKELEIKFQRSIFGWLLARESSSKISAKDVDFQLLNDLLLRESKELYPPRFVISFRGSSTAKNCCTEFKFQGATEEIVKEIILTTAPPCPSIVHPTIDLETVDGTTLLGQNDLRDVRSAVADLAANWEDLGISLGVCPSDLDTILSNNRHSSSGCLREMLKLWLKQSYNVEKYGEPTWRRLVEAVKDNEGGNNPALAQTIIKDHPSSQ